MTDRPDDTDDPAPDWPAAPDPTRPDTTERDRAAGTELVPRPRGELVLTEMVKLDRTRSLREERAYMLRPVVEFVATAAVSGAIGNAFYAALTRLLRSLARPSARANYDRLIASGLARNALRAEFGIELTGFPDREEQLPDGRWRIVFDTRHDRYTAVVSMPPPWRSHATTRVSRTRIDPPPRSVTGRKPRR